MRWVANKAFPHPVLSPLPEKREERDYPHKEFELGCDLRVGVGNRPELTLTWSLSEESILSLIGKGRAIYAAEVSCQKTYLRRLLVSDQPSQQFNFKPGDFHEKTEISGYVACRKDIAEYHSDNFHEEFGGDTFRLLHGDVVAIDAPRAYWWDLELMKPVVTVFQLAAHEKVPANSFDLLWDEDKVQIRMRKKTKERFERMRSMRKMEAFLLNSVYLSAVTDTLRLMAEDGAQYQDKKWYRAIMHKIDERKIRLNNDANFVKIAQQLLELPLGRMLEAGEKHYEN